MTIRDFCETMCCFSYDKIIVHWPYEDDPNDTCQIESSNYEAIAELFGDIHILTMGESSDLDGSDGSLFIERNDNETNILIYLTREQMKNHIEKRQGDKT